MGAPPSRAPEVGGSFKVHASHLMEAEVWVGNRGPQGALWFEWVPTAKQLPTPKYRGGLPLSSSNYEPNRGRLVTCKMWFFSLYFVKYMIFITWNALWKKLKSLLYTILYWESLILEVGGLQLPKIGGGQRKLRGGEPWKTGGGSLAVGSYLQRGSAPLPPPMQPPGAEREQWIQKFSDQLILGEKKGGGQHHT